MLQTVGGIAQLEIWKIQTLETKVMDYYHAAQICQMGQIQKLISQNVVIYFQNESDGLDSEDSWKPTEGEERNNSMNVVFNRKSR